MTARLLPRRLLGDPPSKNWEAIRAEYWKEGEFLLGDFKLLARFLAMSGGGKSKSIEPVLEAPINE